MSGECEEVGAAKAWGISWDYWEQKDAQARGVMLARYRAENKMRAWEQLQHKREADRIDKRFRSKRR